MALTPRGHAHLHRIGRVDQQAVHDGCAAVMRDAVVADGIEDGRHRPAQSTFARRGPPWSTGKHQPLQWNMGSVHR